ncbi:uncharacterized protein [Malus domestica]|uniref:uncharacterized protein n=1 Tax=Malus domestica TaxID=3750 RepID=UPI00397617AA
MTSVCLVHLGGRDFCFVETGQSQHLADIQHIGVTTFEIVDDGEEGNPVINTLHSTVYAVDTSDLETFDIDFGFATWLDDVEPEGEIMTLLIEQEEAECKTMPIVTADCRHKLMFGYKQQDDVVLRSDPKMIES